MKTTQLIATGILLSASVHSVAANKFDYAGISAVNNTYEQLNFAPDNEEGSFSPLIYETESSGTGLKVFMGHHFNAYFAIQAGLSSFGKPSFSVSEEVVDDEGDSIKKTRYSGNFTTISADVQLIVTYPLSDRFFIKGFTGTYIWSNEIDTLVNNEDEFVVVNSTETGTSILTGLGVGYSLNNSLALTIEFETTEIATVSSDTIGFSLLYKL